MTRHIILYALALAIGFALRDCLYVIDGWRQRNKHEHDSDSE